MVKTNYQDLNLKFMVPLMHILDRLFGDMLEFQIKLQCHSINNIRLVHHSLDMPKLIRSDKGNTNIFSYTFA